MKTKSKESIQFFSEDEGKSIVTSFSLPLWNKRRLQHIVHKLNQKGHDVSIQEIAIQSLNLIMTKLKRKNNAPLLNRAVRYNSTKAKYENIPARLSPQQYNSFQTKKLMIKTSLSYLLDLALRMYLKFICNLFLQKSKTIYTDISYYKVIKNNDFNKQFFFEEVQFIIRI